MEKGQIAAFLPMVVFCCIFLVLIIGFIVLVVYLLKKAKESSWDGKILDKKHTTHRDFDTDVEEDNYVLVVETSSGIKKSISVAKEMYNECKVGDRIKKEKGEMRPKKV